MFATTKSGFIRWLNLIYIKLNSSESTKNIYIFGSCRVTYASSTTIQIQVLITLCHSSVYPVHLAYLRPNNTLEGGGGGTESCLYCSPLGCLTKRDRMRTSL